MKCIEISNLGIVVEPQQERHLNVVGSLPDDDSLSITPAVCLLCRKRMPAARKYLLDLSPPADRQRARRRSFTVSLPCLHQAVAANGGLVQAVSSAAPRSAAKLRSPQQPALFVLGVLSTCALELRDRVLRLAVCRRRGQRHRRRRQRGRERAECVAYQQHAGRLLRGRGRITAVVPTWLRCWLPSRCWRRRPPCSP